MFFLDFNRRQARGFARSNINATIQKLAPFAPPDWRDWAETDSIQLVQCGHWNLDSSRRPRVQCSEDDIALGAWARIDNREDLAEGLGLSRSEMDEWTDAEVIRRAYRRWGENCVGRLVGDFVFVLYDGRERKLFCARDPLGVRPLYYFLSPDRFVCATTLAALVGLEGIPVEPDRRWMADYFTGLSMSFDRTPYPDIQKLPPAHCLTVTERSDHLRAYFRLGENPPLRLKDSRECLDAYRETLETAIRCRVRTDYPLGSELSGGLDSSTVTAFAARFWDKPLSRFHAFGFAFLDMEPQYILAVSQALELPHTHIVASRQADADAVADRAQRVLGYPVEHGNATFHEPFYQLAEALGVRTLLSGFGGDEFSTTIHGYMVPLDLARRGRFRELHRTLGGNDFMRFLRLIRMVLKRVKTRNFTRPAYNLRFLKAFQGRWPHQIVQKEWVERFDLEKRWAPFVPTRMENCSLMAAARKIEYRWPLLDVRLVRLFLRLPAELHYHRGMGRHLHRRAMSAAAEKEGRGDINNRNIQRWQNIHAAVNLDRWLKAIFPAGRFSISHNAEKGELECNPS